jgi:hypothetical protein
VKALYRYSTNPTPGDNNARSPWNSRINHCKNLKA